MPIYEYRCQSCRRKVEIFFRSVAQAGAPVCAHCGSTTLTRLVSRVTVVKSWGSTMNPPESLMDGVDEDDPKAMMDWMKRIKQELGDEAPELDEMDLMDAGVSHQGFDGQEDALEAL